MSNRIFLHLDFQKFYIQLLFFKFCKFQEIQEIQETYGFPGRPFPSRKPTVSPDAPSLPGNLRFLRTPLPFQETYGFSGRPFPSRKPTVSPDAPSLPGNLRFLRTPLPFSGATDIQILKRRFL